MHVKVLTKCGFRLVKRCQVYPLNGCRQNGKITAFYLFQISLPLLNLKIFLNLPPCYALFDM